MTLLQRARRTHVLLLHYPILNRNGEVVTTAVTNLDIHDISRASRTYGVAGYHIVTPIKLQRELVEKIVRHWQEGWGATHNPKRSEAFTLTTTQESLDAAIAAITMQEGERPLLVATSAREVEQRMFTYKELRHSPKPVALIFGTGWGIAPQVAPRFDGFLPPIQGPVPYNHLSVRSAVSIILDRYLGVQATTMGE